MNQYREEQHIIVAILNEFLLQLVAVHWLHTNGTKMVNLYYTLGQKIRYY
jgi:hypothetical protein